MRLAVESTRRGWRIAVFGVLLFTLASPETGRVVAGWLQADDPVVAALPQEVRAALDRAARVYPQPLSGARWSEVHLLGGIDHPVFQVRGTNGRGNKIELEVTGAGRVIEVEEHGIPVSEVPGAVTDALKTRMPDFTPTQVEAIYQAERGQPVSFGFEGKDPAGRKKEVYISADGKTILN